MSLSTTIATNPSKGARKRQARRAARIASEISAGRGAEALNRRVLEGLHEIRRRGMDNLRYGAFPFVEELIWDLVATFGAQEAEAVRSTLELEAVLAVSRATGTRQASLVGGYRAVEERRLRELRRR